MNPEITAARAYPITDYLAAKGIQPERTTAGKAFFFSPFRAERTPSFCVYLNSNRYQDFGTTEKSSDIISLVMKLEGCSFKEAVSRLLAAQGQFTPIREQFTPADPTQSISLKKVKALENRALLQYMESRGINPQLVRLTVPQLGEGYFQTNKGSNFFAITFRNDKSGYEWRNGTGNNGKGYKGCIGSKAISTVHGTEGKNCIVFEGFFDFLSYLQMHNSSRMKSDAVVLNSVSNSTAAAPTLAKYDRVYLCLDRDKAGNEATQQLQSILPQAQDIRSKVITHPDAKDVNDQLIRTR